MWYQEVLRSVGAALFSGMAPPVWLWISLKRVVQGGECSPEARLTWVAPTITPMGWTCLIEKLQQHWEFGKENRPGQEIFYKEEAQGREGECEEILLRGWDMDLFWGALGTFSCQDRGVFGKGSGILGGKERTPGPGFGGEILERTERGPNNRVPVSEWSAMLKGLKDHPSRSPSKDRGRGGGSSSKLLRAISKPVISSLRSIPGSYLLSISAPSPSVQASFGSGMHAVPSIRTRILIFASGSSFPQQPGCFLNQSWRSYFLVKMSVLGFPVLSGNSFPWPLTDISYPSNQEMLAHSSLHLPRYTNGLTLFFSGLVNSTQLSLLSPAVCPTPVPLICKLC